MDEIAGTRVGWVGAGKMGGPMCRHLVAAGCRVRLYEPDPDRRAAAQRAGAAIVDSPRAAATDIDLVFSSLPDDGALLAAALGESGILAGAAPATVYVETSTVSPEASAMVARAASQHDVAYLRAPVSGNATVAEAAKLTFLLSGPKPAWERHRGLLGRLGERQYHVGEGEEARYLKLAINLMVGGTVALLAEALALGRRGGLDWVRMLEVIDNSAVASPVVFSKIEPLKTRDFTPTFTTRQMVKDMGLVLAAGRQSGVPLTLTALVHEAYEATVAQGDGALDYAAIVRLSERLAGLSDEPARDDP